MFGLRRRYVEVMMSWITRHWRWALPTAVVLAGVGTWLFFGFFAFQTYFIDDQVDEALPFAAGPAPSGMEGDETTQEQADAMNEAMAEQDMPKDIEVDEPMPDEMPDSEPASATGDADESVSVEPDGAEAVSEQTDAASGGEPSAESAESSQEEAPAESADTTAPPEPVEPQIVLEASGSFIDRSHPTEGDAQVLGDGSGQRFLRLEDFRTDNGPDLNVYLSAAPPDAPAGAFDDDFVDLGDLKGNVGSQNYEIPVGLDLDRYSTVAIWCVRFGVVFGAAELTAG